MVSTGQLAPKYKSTAPNPEYAGTPSNQQRRIFIGGSVCPKLIIAPLDSIGSNVPVVITSTSLAALLTPTSPTRAFNSSAVQTIARFWLILSLISAIVRIFNSVVGWV
jgi:hypothetical protein